MKHVFVKGLFAVYAALLFASCYSYPIRADNRTKNIVYWDENLPREESVELAFLADHLTVTSYNGISVDWGKKPLVFLPPGPTFFTVDIHAEFDFGMSTTRYTGNSVFIWDFKAGDRYLIQVGVRELEPGVEKPGVVLWDMEVKRTYTDMEFFPFPES
jgi:hypothetical protein